MAYKKTTIGRDTRNCSCLDAARLVLGTLAILGSPATAGANWTLFATCGDQGRERLYSYDPGSVKNAGGSYVVPIAADYSHVPGSVARTARLLWTVDCRARSFVEKSRVDYGPTGHVLQRYKSTGRMNIIPQSVADKLAKKLCG